jgi:ABC-type transport system involved in cytochrome c biogenesis ATPase subunit
VTTRVPQETEPPAPLRLAGIRDLHDVNALPNECEIHFNPGLTLIFGANGSGKTGVARLLANACFSRGQRDVLPNLEKGSPKSPAPRATFVLADLSGNLLPAYEYTLGAHNDSLKRFAVFDIKSVPIHLDDSNKVTFSPAYVQVFDRVAIGIRQIESRLAAERQKVAQPNPFATLFLLQGEASTTSQFCQTLSSRTTDDQFLSHANYVAEVDDPKVLAVTKELEAKRKLDVAERKASLLADAKDLETFAATLQRSLGQVGNAVAATINKNTVDIAAQRNIVTTLGAKSFDDGVVVTTGSDVWKALLTAAKELYDYEVKARTGAQLTHCLLCRQALRPSEHDLFQRYWNYLASKAETELTELLAKQATVLANLRSVKAGFPKYDDSLAAVKVLRAVSPTYLTTLVESLDSFQTVVVKWIADAERADAVDANQLPAVNLTQIQAVADRKRAEANSLVDPATEITRLTATLAGLKHRKLATELKDKALAHLRYLRWSAKADSVNFAAIKTSTTKQRKEIFLAEVADQYKTIFNTNLTALGCDRQLVMWTSGEQGSTVKEFKLSFSDEHLPSKILSEGEQNVCALADFLTEVSFDSTNCGLIFDDPVTSLDHERKTSISERLVEESRRRQVIVFTHDPVFMTKLVRYADEKQLPFATHWMRTIRGKPGHVEEDSSPKCATTSKLKEAANRAVQDFETLDGESQERALGAALDYLRAGCESLIEEKLFGKAIQRYEDQVRVQNLEEVVFDQSLALRIVTLHGRLSEVILAHNRSDQMREQPPTISDFKRLRQQFDEIDAELSSARKTVLAAREAKKKSKVATW